MTKVIDDIRLLEKEIAEKEEKLKELNSKVKRFAEIQRGDYLRYVSPHEGRTVDFVVTKKLSELAQWKGIAIKDSAYRCPHIVIFFENKSIFEILDEEDL